MMRRYRLRIGLDVDDTLYECNSYALDLLRSKYGDDPALDLNRIEGWGTTGTIADKRLKFFEDPDFVLSQPLYPDAKRFVHRLTSFADVFFVTAVPPACMSARARRLLADFPEVPASNILIGTRKDIVNLDILLDDSAHNITTSSVAYPVLMRRPWNNDLSGLLAVNTYDDFVHLAHTIGNSFVGRVPFLRRGGCVCLVGATGTGKTEIAQALIEREGFFKPLTTTTRLRLPDEREDAYRFVDKETFLRQKEAGGFVETTVYGTQFFGTTAEELYPRIEEGQIAVLPIDVCGALTMRNRFFGKTLLVYTERDKRRIVRDILARPIPDEDKVHRLMSLDFEARNRELCDLAVCVDDGVDECVEAILSHPSIRRRHI